MIPLKQKEPLWAEIDLGAIVHNFGIVKRLAGPETKIMAVVKANAYGHGSLEVARSLASAGADALGVARLSEAKYLRDEGIELPILIFGYTPFELTEILVKYNLQQTVFSLSYATQLNQCAKDLHGSVRIHLKIDTGMGRLGIIHKDIAYKDNLKIDEDFDTSSVIAKIVDLPNLEVEGIYTHFASSDSSDKVSACMQLGRFQELVGRLESIGIHIPTRHAANSSAIIDMPEASLDMVRPGIMLYGLLPSDELINSHIDLKPAMQIKASVAQIKKVPYGFAISYGHTYVTPRETTIATVPIGYADGYNRLLSSCGVMIVSGHQSPVVGRVCMDQTMIDVGGIDAVREGDEVVILGKQGDQKITAEMIAKQIGTINYEIVASLMDRVPRVYCHNDNGW